jgi:hypothetical protein
MCDELKNKALFQFFVDEVNIVDYQSWFNIHFYVVKGWKHIPILLTLEEVVNGDRRKNVAKVILGIVFQFEAFQNLTFLQNSLILVQMRF